MLVLSRNFMEKIIIGENVVISILGSRKNEVKIGIEAPKNIPIHRQEVYDRMANGGVIKK